MYLLRTVYRPTHLASTQDLTALGGVEHACTTYLRWGVLNIC